MQQLALALGEKMGLSEEKLDHLKFAAELHDLGKVKVPDSILAKPDNLPEENGKN